jgi:hypothetical protein
MQADRLDGQLARARDNPGAPHAQAVIESRATELIGRARGIAGDQEKVNWLLDLWSGLSVETAWRCLQLAQEELLQVRPAEELNAEAPHLRALATRHKLEPASGKLVPERVDPLAAQSVLEAAHIATNTAHTSVRRLRNRVLMWAALVAAVAIALWACGVAEGATVGLGALGGLLSVVFVAKEADLGAAYNVQLSQGLLKLASGAGTAILAVAILKGSGASADPSHLQEYAAVFGFSQQAFTRLVDEKAKALTGNAPPRPLSAGGGTGAPPSCGS